MGTFDDLGELVHHNSVNKGFYDDYDMAVFKDQAAKLCLVQSEVTEVMEALRKEQGEAAVLDEIADILIRTLDFYTGLAEAGVVTGSLDSAFNAKVQKNRGRPHMHGVLG